MEEPESRQDGPESPEPAPLKIRPRGTGRNERKSGRAGASRRKLLEQRESEEFLSRVQAASDNARPDSETEEPQGWLKEELAPAKPGRPRIAGRDVKPLPLGSGGPPRTPDVVRQTLWARAKLVSVVLLVLLLAVVVYAAAERVGRAAGREELVREQLAADNARVRELPPDKRDELLLAIERARNGGSEADANRVVAIVEAFPDVRSLKYLAALALLQSGRGVEAFAWAEDSIKADGRVADSLALMSVVEGDPAFSSGPSSLADRKERARALLGKATAADPGSIGPVVDLASLLRFTGRSGDAEAQYRAARALLHPVDQHLSIDVTLEMIVVEQMTPGELKPLEPENEDPRQLFRAAYIAMILGDFDKAVALLGRAEAVTRPEDFGYIVSDRGFRRFSYRPELQPFFRR